MTSDTRRSTLAAALTAAILCAGFLAPNVARAEIIDYNPATDTVPEILEPAEIARYESLTGARFLYMISPPSPDGKAVLAYHGQGVDFINLKSGAIIPIAAEPAIPGPEISDFVWLDKDTLASLNLEPQEDGSAKYYRVERKASTGAVTVTPIDIQVDGQIVSASPLLDTLLVMEFPTDNPPPARSVTLGPRYEAPEGNLPPGIDSLGELPGVTNQHPLGTLEVQQAGFNLILQNLDGSRRRPLTSATAETALTGVSWQPDGEVVAFGLSTMPGWDGDRQRDNDPPAAGLPNLGNINVQEALGRVAPADNPLVTGTRIAVYDDLGNEMRTFNNVDFQQGLLNQIIFSSTGRYTLLSIATRSPLDDRPNPTYANPMGLEWHLFHHDDPAGEIELPGIDGLYTSAEFAGDDHIVFTVADELDSRVLLYDPRAGQARTLWDKPGSMFQSQSSGAGVVFSHQTVDEPVELWVTEGWGDAGTAPMARPVTRFNRDVRFASGIKWADISWTSGGETLHGIYAYPETMAYPPTSPAPVVVWQQGGPGGQMTNDFGGSVESPYSLLPNFGIPVFVANAAGRTVQSPQFYADMAEGRNFGQLDIQQIKDGVDHLVRQGVADPAKVGITGCSYGGYFTFQSLRSFPGFYAAGNPQCSLVDLTEEFTFGYTPFISYLMGRAPMADAAEYLKDSPFYGTKDMTTPTLIFHGTKDFLPVPLINNMHDQIEANGVDVRFLRAAGYGHGLGMATDANGAPIADSGVNGQRYAFQLQLEFFREHLGTAAAPPSTRPTTVFLPTASNGAMPEVR